MKKQLYKQFGICVICIGLVVSAGSLLAQSASERPDSKCEQPCGQNGQHKGFKKPRFADLDLDGDSFVTLSEFKEKPIPHGDHEMVFGHIDADGNGEITQNEFDSHRPPPRRQGQSGGKIG